MDFSIIEYDDHYIVNFLSEKSAIWYDTFIEADLAAIENGSLVLDKQYIEHLKLAIDDMRLVYSVVKQSDLDIFATVPLPETITLTLKT